MKYPDCKIEKEESRLFCLECGAHLTIMCPDCSFENAREGKFCDGCGQNLTVPSKPTVKGLSFIDDEEIANKLIAGTLG